MLNNYKQNGVGFIKDAVLLPLQHLEKSFKTLKPNLFDLNVQIFTKRGDLFGGYCLHSLSSTVNLRKDSISKKYFD